MPEKGNDFPRVLAHVGGSPQILSHNRKEQVCGWMDGWDEWMKK